MARITVNLREDERRGLLDLANRERRDPRDQAAVLIRERLKDMGVLRTETAVDIQLATEINK